MRRGFITGLALLALLAAVRAAAEQVAPFVVSPQRDVARMMAMADLGPGDYLIDLGSGDGRIVIAAARRGALAHGIELDPALNVEARAAAEAAGVADRTAFLTGDLFEADFRHASVVTLYLFPEAMLRLRPMLLERLEPGTRLISNSFDFGDWAPDEHVEAATSGGILMWIVPAAVEGVWDVRIGARRWPLDLFQVFQEIGGDFGAPARALESATLRGSRIAFDAVIDGVPHRFSGEVDGEAMSGVVQVRGEDGVRIDAWTALRRPEGGAG
jgi:hypothetical protein